MCELGLISVVVLACAQGVRHVRRASLAASQQLPSEEAGKGLSRGGSGKSLESEQEEEDEDDEQEEVPEDLKHLSWAEQQRRWVGRGCAAAYQPLRRPPR